MVQIIDKDCEFLSIIFVAPCMAKNLMVQARCGEMPTVSSKQGCRGRQ